LIVSNNYIRLFPGS